MPNNLYQFKNDDPSRHTVQPTPAAMALASRIDLNTFNDIYKFASEIDRAFNTALEEARQEERDRVLKLSIFGFWRERNAQATKNKR